MRHVLRSARAILLGDAGASLCVLVSLALVARDLGPESFGAYVLARTYGLLVDRILNSATWQAIVKFATDAERSRDRSRYAAIVQWCAGLDQFTALLGATTGILAAGAVGTTLGWTPQTTLWSAWFSAAIDVRAT